MDEVSDRIRAMELVFRIPNRGVSETSERLTLDHDSGTLPQVPGFQIVETLGHGGMGVVFKARHERLNRIVALKMLRGGGRARPIERLRFPIGAESVAALEHPHVVQLFEVGDAGGEPFLALEYVEGNTLAARLRDRPLDYRVAAELVAVLADAVGWAEQTVKWAKRQPAVAALVAAVLSLLVIMAVGGTTMAVIAMRAREHALAAAEGEKKSKEAAQTREKETSQVLGFVENKIFAAARPEGQMGGLGRGVTLRKAIETAVPFMEKSITDEPRIEARLRMTLGTSFYYLGDGPGSAEQNERARDLYVIHVGPDHPDTLRSMSNLAGSYDMLGRFADALELRKKILDGRIAALGSDHPDTVAAMNNLAISYENHGRNAEALELRKEILILDTANFGPDHPQTLATMNNIGISLAGVGRHDEALAMRKTVLASREAKYGREHADTLNAMYTLGLSYADLGRYDDALDVHQETLKLRKTVLAQNHSDALWSTNEVAEYLVHLNRGVEAVVIVDQCVQRAAKQSDDPELVPALMDLRLRHFANEKNPAGCQATAEMWEKLDRTDAESLYSDATLSAVTSALFKAAATDTEATWLADEQADRAMNWLRKAVEAGYNNAAQLAEDNDLDVLRERDDLRKLIAELRNEK
jgi:tetratricopeptide (TPR) repeat protein